MAESIEGKKEVTILGLSQEINDSLFALDVEIANRFRREATCGSEKGERPQIPNVLDEILDELGKAKEHIEKIREFLHHAVFPKINQP